MSDEEGKPDYVANLKDIGLNQMAIPGMEHLSHPGAGILAKGFRFGHFHDTRDGRYQHALTTFAPDQPEDGPPRDPLDAQFMGSATLRWSGKDDSPDYHPGEINWVRSHPGVLRQGHPTAMFKMAHSMEFGQSTVPVHSHDRTDDGERWSSKVGPPELRPEQGDWRWRPPSVVFPNRPPTLGRQFYNPNQDRLFYGTGQ